MEVLQTSALPLGDGAGRTSCLGAGESGRVYTQRQQRSWGPVRCIIVGDSPEPRIQSVHLRATRYGGQPPRGLPTEAHGKRERRLERETGFEPATSTLARSHSTTELFPLATKPKRNTRDLSR